MPDAGMRVWTDTAVLLITALATITQVLPGGNGLRLVSGLLAAILLPGAAILTRFHVDDFATWFGLAVALSFASEAVAGSTALWVGHWRPGIVIAILAIPSVVALGMDLLAHNRQRSETSEDAEDRWR